MHNTLSITGVEARSREMVAFTFTVLLLMLLLRVISVKEFPSLTIKNKITQELCSVYKKNMWKMKFSERKKCNQHKVLD